MTGMMQFLADQLEEMGEVRLISAIMVTEDGDLLVAKLEVRMADSDEPLYSQTDRQQYRTCHHTIKHDITNTYHKLLRGVKV